MRRPWLVFAIVLLGACSVVPPIPDEFDAAFATGQVCVPSQIGNPTAGTEYPVEFRFCLYRCVELDTSTPVRLVTPFQCSGTPGAPCNMVMLATAHVLKKQDEADCDARYLVNPPPGECREAIVRFTPSVPDDTEGVLVGGDFLVTIPYLELEEGERVVARIEAGESPTTVVREEVGVQNYPGRQFTLNFSPSHPVLDASAAIPASDCRTITAP